ncbi:MAG: glycosyltransferase family A protein [Flavobacteriaceae bacterium]|nr:glycosyltransferase family A protein [Flavobacteriaceae bacterium]MDZ4149072.1 glycosyltransferase family A protein [Flavobacteriaceae bacterium]
MPFFSVIIPLYNKEKFIKNTLESVLNQTFDDFELLIVNDGSTDKSEAIVNSFPDKRIQYFFKKNGGVSTARNFGISRANSEYIVFIDADDLWHPDFLKKMKQLIQSHANDKVFACAIELETPLRTFPAQYSFQHRSESQIVNYFRASMKQSVLCCSSSVFHCSVFQNAGLFDEKIKSAEDTDMWIRIGLKYEIVFLNLLLATYVFDPVGLSRMLENYHLLTDFTKFETEEKSNPLLKKYLDYNRFSIAVKQKLIGDKKTFRVTIGKIDSKSLNIKRKMILKLPSFVLKFLIYFKNTAAQLGLGNSVFK